MRTRMHVHAQHALLLVALCALALVSLPGAESTVQCNAPTQGDVTEKFVRNAHAALRALAPRVMDALYEKRFEALPRPTPIESAGYTRVFGTALRTEYEALLAPLSSLPVWAYSDQVGADNGCVNHARWKLCMCLSGSTRVYATLSAAVPLDTSVAYNPASRPAQVEHAQLTGSGDVVLTLHSGEPFGTPDTLQVLYTITQATSVRHMGV